MISIASVLQTSNAFSQQAILSLLRQDQRVNNQLKILQGGGGQHMNGQCFKWTKQFCCFVSFHSLLLDVDLKLIAPKDTELLHGVPSAT